MSEALVKKSEGETRQLQYVGGISTGTGIAAYEPTDLKAAMDLSQVLCAGELVPKALRNKPGDVLVLIATGRDYGLAWPSALQNLYAVNGRVGAYAEFQRARIMQHSTCELFELVEATGERATIRVKKPTMDAPADVSFTIEDAIQARLLQRLANGDLVGVTNQGDPRESNWTKYREDMLVARATTRAKRRYFPYVLTDLASVEELQDLPVEKNITPVNAKAEDAAQKIAAAAGRKAPTETEVREQEQREEVEAAKAAQTLAHFGDEGESEPPPPAPNAEGAEAWETLKREGSISGAMERAAKAEGGDVLRISDATRRELLKSVDGVGPKVLSSLDEAGAINARSILRLGVSGLKKLPGVGPKTAESLIAWATKRVDDTNRAEALAKKDEAAGEEPKAEEPTFYRDAAYVEGLMRLADKHGVTTAQLRTKLDELAATLDLPAGLNPRALPDPQWVTLQKWVQSATQEALPLAEQEPAAPEADPGGPYISEARQAMIGRTVENLVQKMDAEAGEGWLADFAAWCRENAPAAEAGVSKRDFSKIPEVAYGNLLAWITDSTSDVR